MAVTFTARTLFRSCCIVFLSSLIPLQAAPLSPQGPMPANQIPYNPADDPFSPENIAQVAEEISKLSPEQQEQLYKESLDFLSKELNLAPEEVEKMIMDEFTQAGGTLPETPQQPVEKKALEETPAIQPIVEKEIPLKDSASLAALLKNITDETDLIMRKASNIPDLPSKVERWLEQNKLSSWQKGLSWARFKQQVELFVQKLGKLQDKNMKTNTYIYLPELFEQTLLKNNLERLYRMIKRYNASFAVKTLDIDAVVDDPLTTVGSLDESAKNALLGILNSFGETLYQQNIISSLDALIRKFEPTAQKLRSEEEALSKKALEASKAPRQTARVKESGSSFGGGSYYNQPMSHEGYYPNYGGSSGYPSYGSQYGSPESKTDSSTAQEKNGTIKTPESSKKSSEDSESKKAKNTVSEEKLKWMRDLSKECSEDIRALAAKLSQEVLIDAPIKENTLSEIETLYKKIATDSKDLMLLSKDNKTVLTPLKESFALHKDVFEQGSKKIASLAAAQEPSSETVTKAQAYLNSFTEIQKNLGEQEELSVEEINKLASLTKRPLSGMTSSEAKTLIDQEKKEYSTIIDKNTQAQRLKSLARNLAEIERLIK